jgi:hypothetical protein
MSTSPIHISIVFPPALRDSMEDTARADGSIEAAHQQTAQFFAERRARANPAAALAVLSDGGGEPPQSGDELPRIP